MATANRIAALVVALASGSSLAAAHREIDVGAQSQPDGMTYQVSLCARPSVDTPKNKPGHAFVGFSRSRPGGERTYTALGHTTFAGTAAALLSYQGYLGSVPGYISAERYSHVNERCLVINTSKELYERAWRIAAGYKAILEAEFEPGEGISLDYSLGADDCMAFANSVAIVFAPAVKIPSRGATELPMDYVRRLIDSN